MKTWMTRREAAVHVRQSESHLANLASRGEGPRYFPGRPVLYRVADLDAWIEERAGADLEAA